MEWALLHAKWEDGSTSDHWFASPTGDEWLEFAAPPLPEEEVAIATLLRDGRTDADGHNWLPMRAARRYLELCGQRPGGWVKWFDSYPGPGTLE